MPLPRLVMADGAIETLKWLALVLMTVDHVNKYLLHESGPAMFAAGRLAFPLFSFVLAYNLARPEALARGTYQRTLKRLALYGAVAEVPFIALGGLGWGWWPLNIMAMLFVATATMYLVEKGGRGNLVLVALLMIVGGGIVEFWWPGIVMCLGAWCYCKRPSLIALAVWWGATASLFIVNKNWWALVSLPLVLVATRVDIGTPRWPRLFYVYYPAHLAALFFIQQLRVIQGN